MTFYFAWVADGDVAFDEYTHSVEDEEVFGFEIVHSEGDLAELKVDIRNPKENLVDPYRPLWAWLSQDGTPLFLGRLVAAPQDIQSEIVSVSFLARPSNYDAAKSTLADTLKVAPYWDPVWINPQRLDDPDAVLEARPELYHVDRVTHAVTVSNVIAGEDGLITLDVGDHFYDDVRVSYGAAPLTRVRVNAAVTWTQVAFGTLDLTQKLLDAFKAKGSPKNTVSSYTGQGLEADWPKQNSNLKGGYTVGAVRMRRLDGTVRPARSKLVKVRNTTSTGTQGDTTNQVLSVPGTAQFFVWEFKPEFPIDYDVSRRYIETMSFSLEADVQPLMVDPGEDSELIIDVTSRAVGEGNSPPIGDLRRNSYFKTDRGLQSFEYLLMLARAKLLARARTVNVQVGIPFDDGLSLSCRKNVRVIDPRFPDGEATGKVIEYRMVASGDGLHKCFVTIGCTIGEGNSLVVDPGDPVYAEEAYTDDEYQEYTGGELAIPDDEIKYSDYRTTAVDDDGINFLNLKIDDLVEQLVVYNGEDDQETVLDGTFQDIPAAIEALNAQFTEVELELTTLKGGPFETAFAPTVSKLMVPQTIAL